ncbi:uncharacterized protein CLUP02_00396 [Colletotrichum lupini]|uniref:Uncharacterized protein n=1 Tax=Colletotrichum lupini TaxID=145971 RepID=A0A9Q8SAZ9_9PEZI|nr:uncharacterized protein CLUP02_00396 [Colletotrichum lupini]UQC73750.1 hypothetical protein CLUP02_00396 [Colletotrichum lupini]
MSTKRCSPQFSTGRVAHRESRVLGSRLPGCAGKPHALHLMCCSEKLPTRVIQKDAGRQQNLQLMEMTEFSKDAGAAPGVDTGISPTMHGWRRGSPGFAQASRRGVGVGKSPSVWGTGVGCNWERQKTSPSSVRRNFGYSSVCKGPPPRARHDYLRLLACPDLIPESLCFSPSNSAPQMPCSGPRQNHKINEKDQSGVFIRRLNALVRGLLPEVLNNLRLLMISFLWHFLPL